MLTGCVFLAWSVFTDFPNCPTTPEGSLKLLAQMGLMAGCHGFCLRICTISSTLPPAAELSSSQAGSTLVYTHGDQDRFLPTPLCGAHLALGLCHQSAGTLLLHGVFASHPLPFSLLQT
jgi:hypothetical protein